MTQLGHDMRKHFAFHSQWTNMNHGSFGTYPIAVRDKLRHYQDCTEEAPDKFMFYEYIPLLDTARKRVADLLNAPVDECVFVLNATTGVNTVLRNLKWNDSDAIIYFDTVYSAMEKSLFSLNETFPQIHLRRITNDPACEYKLPCTHTDIVNAFSQTVSRLIYDGYKPKVALFDTIVSLPGVRFPFERLVKICKEYGILSIIDGAHGVGHIPIDLASLDPDFFVSNCHKWLYTPRGNAVFFVPKRNQHLIRTTIPTSHGYIPPPEFKVRRVLPPSDKSDFVNLFQFVGTADNSPFYCVPAALEFRKEVCGGENAIHQYIRSTAQRGADIMARILGTEVMDDVDVAERKGRDQSMTWVGGLRDCALANVLMPFTITGDELDSVSRTANSDFVCVKRADVQRHIDWIHRVMTYDFDTRVLVYEYGGRIWTRVSGQTYLELKDFEWLGGILRDLCKRIGKGESLTAPNGSLSLNGTKAKVEADTTQVSRLEATFSSLDL